MLNREEFRKFAIKGQGLGSNIVDQYLTKIESMTVPNITNMNVPQDMTTYVIEERPGNFRAIDVFTRLI
jgi:ATP-dependent Clp protease protease subunit